MADVQRWHEWTPSITSITPLDADTLAAGRRFVSRQPKLPRAIWTVSEVRAGHRFTWVSTAPGLRVSAVHAVESTASGSRITLSIEMQGLLGGIWGRLTRRLTERYLALEAEGLKARSEASGAPVREQALGTGAEL